VADIAGERVARSNAVTGASALSLGTSFSAFLSAAACCVLPLLLGWLGIGASSLAAFVPFHWPLTIASLVAVVAAWILYARQVRARGPRRSTLIVLIVASVLMIVSLSWSLIEAPLMRSLT
jgi:mercuric ion transport protein